MKPAFTTRALILASAVLAFSGSFATAGETVYRWKDEAGNQVNSDRPPPLGVEYETISTSSSMVHAVDSPGKSTPAAATASAGTAAPASATAEATPPVSHKNPEQCARARDNLTQLDTHARIRLRDNNGEVRFLSEEEKQAEKQKTLEAIKAFCE